jgi:hypothetical protein
MPLQSATTPDPSFFVTLEHPKLKALRPAEAIVVVVKKVLLFIDEVV